MQQDALGREPPDTQLWTSPSPPQLNCRQNKERHPSVCGTFALIHPNHLQERKVRWRLRGTGDSCVPRVYYYPRPMKAPGKLCSSTCLGLIVTTPPPPHHTHTRQSFPCPVWSTGETGLWRARADRGHSLGHQVSGWLSLDNTQSLGHLREQHCSKRGVTSKADSVLFLLQVSY